ncbi:MAG TPA: sodium/proton antiporter, partial [Gammaproteobacteria bacterium]|nr:sodium/proton antiporter [Gammaproteobacteria bacterium]
MIKLAYNQFLGDSPEWFKRVILLFLVVCLPLKYLVGTTILGWLFLGIFILTLAMALKCYPLQSGGIVALAILALGLTSPETVWHEIQANLGVLALLIFMVSFIYFMKPLLSFLFARLIVSVKSKWVLSLMFSVMAAFLSAFLDALTVTAVLIAVFVALHGVYERVRIVDVEDRGSVESSAETLEGFRAFIRSLVMHGAVGTALGGVTTMVGEPQNLLIAEKMDWEFIEFVIVMSHVTIPAVIAGFVTCIVLELTGILGY